MIGFIIIEIEIDKQMDKQMEGDLHYHIRVEAGYQSWVSKEEDLKKGSRNLENNFYKRSASIVRKLLLPKLT